MVKTLALWERHGSFDATTYTESMFLSPSLHSLKHGQLGNTRSMVNPLLKDEQPLKMSFDLQDSAWREIVGSIVVAGLSGDSD